MPCWQQRHVSDSIDLIASKESILDLGFCLSDWRILPEEGGLV
jgi:hypothetical protein